MSHLNLLYFSFISLVLFIFPLVLLLCAHVKSFSSSLYKPPLSTEMFKFSHALLLNSFSELLQGHLEGLLPLSFPCGSAGVRRGCCTSPRLQFSTRCAFLANILSQHVQLQMNICFHWGSWKGPAPLCHSPVSLPILQGYELPFPCHLWEAQCFGRSSPLLLLWSLRSLLLPSINEDQKRAVRRVIGRSLMARQRAGDGRGCQQTHTCSGSTEWVAMVSANTAAHWGLRYLTYSTWMERHKCRR